MQRKFLPVTLEDMQRLAWDQADFVLVTGDAYVDHHSFGAAIISRVLENGGFKVGIIAQPDWKNTADFQRLGRPRLGFLVTAGNMDSMVNHYAVSKKHREKDYYSPGGKMGLRPDRATIVYCHRIRNLQKYTDDPRRRRGQSRRLLTMITGRIRCAIHPYRQRGGSAGVRHGREADPGDRPIPQ
jgi:uncharacterized radical SAM protein YgiQ